jgi:hypothetical protein
MKEAADKYTNPAEYKTNEFAAHFKAACTYGEKYDLRILN